MPRFYFDIRDENGLQVDEEGIELDSLDEARSEAQRALADMARDAIVLAGGMVVCIEIRVEGDTRVEAVAASSIRLRQPSGN